MEEPGVYYMEEPFTEVKSDKYFMERLRVKVRIQKSDVIIQRGK